MIPFQKQFILPQSNIAETKDSWEIIIYVPAIDPLETSISVKNGKINIKGKISLEKFDSLKALAKYDLFYSTSFALPENIQVKNMRARITGDKMTIRIPKIEESLLFAKTGQKAYFNLQGFEHLTV